MSHIDRWYLNLFISQSMGHSNKQLIKQLKEVLSSAGSKVFAKRELTYRESKKNGAETLKIPKTGMLRFF